MKIVEGKKIASLLKESLKKIIKEKDLQKSLAIFYVGENPVIDNFINLKKKFGEDVGVRVRVFKYEESITTQKLVKEIGAVFGQRSQLWLHLPPKDTFDLLAQIYDLGKHDYKVRRDLLVERFELGDFIDTPVRKLSLGQRMRCEIAASLLHRPRLLLLDEPTIGIDVVARQRLRELICQWNKEEGLTVFLTSHDTGDIASVASRMVLINHGRIVLDDTVASVSQTVIQEGLEGDLEQVIAHLFAQPAASSAGLRG